MSLGQAHARIIGNQGAMKELWQPQIQSLVKQQLPGGGFEQVFATDNFSDGHGVVVDHDGEMIRG
jgi:hypothetical protein